MSSTIETLNQIVKDGISRGLGHLYTEDSFLTGKSFTIEGQELVNFGSCSYLGLETHPALKQGVVDAVIKYGTQFSSSRTYLSLGLYKDLEKSLSTIFQKPVIVAASTTLGHLATLPTIIGKNDAVVLDLQAHSSIQMTTQLLKARKIPVYIIRHNCMDSLEKKIQHLNNKHDKIWYFADGVYSMYGDFAPFAELENLLNKYKKFHLYIDDAHGMGWAGKNGVGVVRSHMEHHDKMVLAVSLNKSFGAAGGCLVFPNKEMEENVRNCGSTYMFCGPIQPPMLGAAIASVNLHLSQELEDRQKALKVLIDHTNQRLNELNLPQYMQMDSPLFFIPVGLPKTIYDIIGKMKNDGFYLNAAAFPAVPMKKGGIRFMINGNLTIEDIDNMLESLQANYIETILEIGSSCEEVAKAFGIAPFKIKVEGSQSSETINKNDLKIEMHRSILNMKKTEWDLYFAGQGNLSYENIKMIEKVFTNQSKPENNWDFYYCTIRDVNDQVILKTFYTCALVKDDMFSPASISKQVEKMREQDSYALTSKNVMTGSMITKGEHVYLNKNHENWKDALELLLNQMQVTMEQLGATKLMIRDFIGKENLELKNVMLELGLINYNLLNNCVVNNLTAWNTRDEYLAQLGQKYRYNVKKEILKFEDRFIVKTEKPQTEKELEACYDLYTAVFEKSYELNVFKLPKAFFQQMCEDSNYDVIRLYLKPEFAGGATEPVLVGVMFSQLNHTSYNAMIVGLDYQYLKEHNTYKQIMFQTLLRAKELGESTLDLAYTAELVKKKLGAKIQEVRAYVQAAEHYNYQILDAMLQ
ncbi:MAG: aminotransferase class I/II-fold pyridoxal phosphate-dependent enzyme [Aureispira sp.]|nr:aminotransferase class I/II-fold pyridoxal phosphate-dependent enzyme [Aureispira sp.]